MITVGRHLVSLDGGGIVGGLKPRAFCFSRAVPMFNCAWGATSLYGPVLTISPYISAVRSIDRKRNVAPELEAFAGEIENGDVVLALQNLLEIRDLGLLLQQLLIFLERLFRLPPGFVTAGDEVLRLRRVIRQRPHLHHAACGFDRQAVSFLVESGLGDLQLIFGARLLPFALAANGFVGPAFSRPIDQRGRRPKRERQQNTPQ